MKCCFPRKTILVEKFMCFLINVIMCISFFLLTAVLWFLRCRNDRSNIFNVIQLAVHVAAASSFGHLRSSRLVSRVTFGAGIVHKRTSGTSLSTAFVLAHDRRRSLPKYRYLLYHQRGECDIRNIRNQKFD